MEVSIIASESHHPVARPSANFHPSVWGEYFLAYDSEVQEKFSEEEGILQQLKEEIRKMLTETPDEFPGKLDLIDNIQRLGVSYHFESEIEASLHNIFNAYDELNHKDGNDLYNIALRFRLLRQQGFYSSCDVFNKFKNPEGDFKESLVSNVRGMVSLYEAANFGVHGENVFEEALKYTTNNLQLMVPNLSNFLAAQVVQALKQPMQKTLTGTGARQYIFLYQQDESHDKLLLKFAKLNFNILQKFHQKEVYGLKKWSKGLDFAKNVPFARDRLVECYFRILAVYFEPKYCLARRILPKVIAMASIIDDIYDVYATLDELVVFTDAIERDYVLKIEEYMKVALVTGAYVMLATTSLVGMGDLVTTQAFEWVTNEPSIVRAASVICRLMDDMVGHEFEQERGHAASAVECYMNEYGASKQESFEELQKRVTNAWKDINGECLKSNAVPMEVIQRVVNLAKVINMLYQGDDGYTHSATKTKNLITSVLVDPVPI